MPDSIREQILQAFGTRLTSLLIANQYQTDMGGEVLRGQLPPINYAHIPAVGYHVEDEENTALYARKDKRIYPVRVQGVAAFGSVAPPVMAEKLYADIIECVLSDQFTLNFDSGGTTEIAAGNWIVGETSAAQGVVISVSLGSGSWGAGNAAGTFTLRRVKGQFANNENISVGVSTNLATVDGILSGQSANDLAGGGLTDGITFVGGGVVMPETDDLTVSANILFQIQYNVLAGNPYSQT
jgi:hypothetical protein